jgi:hypothetical protein
VIEPAYPAANLAAQRIHFHFAHHAGESAAHVPDPPTIRALVDAVFWASLRREEGYIPRISLAYLAPEDVPHGMRFGTPLPLTPESLTRVAPAVERPGIHLGVWAPNGELEVWGATRALPPFSFVLEVVNPGVLAVKHSRGGDAGKFVNVAVLDGDRVKIIDERAATDPECPALLTSLLGLESHFAAESPSSVLVQLALSMRAHGRGGLLLVVPSGSAAWRESILEPIRYFIQPPYAKLAELAERRADEAALRGVIDGIAGLTAVDGATILTNRYELLAFGAKIVRRPRWPQVRRLLITEPVEGAAPLAAEPGVLGGTRHLAAAQFAHDQRDAVAMVASQDGRFTAFEWSPCESMVHAHRIEALLL